jgi:protochlorophyllide reductase
MNKWTTKDIPDLHGRVALVTGANSGLGLETTRALADHGAQVIMACRSLDKAREAEAEIKKTAPDAGVTLVQLDLASLASVRDLAATMQHTHDRLDLLFNNAGIMAFPRSETKDGFELQFGTNHLGHFALTGELLPLLLATPHSRVVTTTSLARTMGQVQFDDLNRTRSYGRWEAYGQSKRANLLFTFELQRRFARVGASTISVAAHPGWANTQLQSASVAASGSLGDRVAITVMGPLLGQSQQMGALPQIYAGTSPDIHGGEVVGPGGFMHMRGSPTIERKAQREDDSRAAARLWEASVELTGVVYALLLH